MSIKRVIGGISASIANKFTDTFNRADNPTELGRSTDGSLWQTLRGTWQISGNTATSNTTASSVPAAMVSVPGVNVTGEVVLPSNGTNGQGLMLWVTDANNWWSVDLWQTTGTQCNAYAAAYNTYTTNYTYCLSPNYTYYCNAWAQGTCNGYNHAYYKNPTYCKGYNYNCSGGWFYGVSGCNMYAGGSYSNYAYAGYYYCTSSTTIYPKYLRVMQMVAGTLSQLSSVLLGDAVGVYGFKATTVGNQITARAYSDVNLTTQVGSDLVYTATGATITTSYGIKISPSDVSQGTQIDSVTITRND